MDEIKGCTLNRVNGAVDLLVMMTVVRLAQLTKESTNSLLPKFLKSGTGMLLLDAKSRLWWDGPAAIAEMYLEETGKYF